MSARIFLAFEDKLKDGLFAVVRKITRLLREQRGIQISLELYCDSLNGNGGWRPHVKTDWPLMRHHGIPRMKGGSTPIDHIVYVLDADCVDGSEGILNDVTLPPRDSPEWHSRANEELDQALRRLAGKDPERVHGYFLRWSKETLVFAAHDQPEILSLLRHKVPFEQARETLFAKCQPRPDSVKNGEFVLRYATSRKCLDHFQTSFDVDLKPGKKKQDSVDSAITAFADRNPALLIERVPDLRGLAELLLELGGAPAAPP